MSHYGTRDDPNQKIRISGYLNLVNGNGSLTLNVKNIQYNESGTYKLNVWSRKKTPEVGISVNVLGKTRLNLSYQ